MNEDTMPKHSVPTYYDNVMRTQGLDPAAFTDPLLGRTFGGSMGGTGYSKLAGSETALGAKVAAGGVAAVLEVVLETVEGCAGQSSFLTALASRVAAEAARGSVAAKDAAHASVWAELWGRSHVDISAGPDAASATNTSDPRDGGRLAGEADGRADIAVPENVAAVNNAYVWQRYLDLCDGRDTWGLIKFNGQAFTTSLNGTQEGHKKGVVSADYRDWGPSNWIQNARQPYYAALSAGDSDIILGILRYFNRSLPVARARVKATIGIGGAFWPETSTLFGTYDAAFLGYGCNGSDSSGHLVAAEPAPYTVSRDSRDGAGPTAPAVNGYTRFYSSGSLEVCFLGLEEYLTSLDEAVLKELTLPICDAVTQFYRERFPHTNSTTGKTDMFPAQVIESYWCGNGGAGSNAWGHVDAEGASDPSKAHRPYGRNDCPTDGAPDVAGLHAILPKLLALPSTALAAYAESAKAWADSLKTLPELATEVCHTGGWPSARGPPNKGCRHCASGHNASSCWCNGHEPCLPPTNSSTIVAIAGQYAGIRQHNHENQAAYAIWPFRQFAVGKPELEVGVETYEHRPHPCNHNWCQDVADAAMLNLSTDAARQVVERAIALPMASLDGVSRFGGFSQHYEDYSPAVDHLSMMRIAVHEMLLGRLDDADQTITLFPSWPVEWDVDFKLKGPLNTTVEAACVRGKLTKLVVMPPSRKAHVKVYNCRQP
jgi:hypothetical protein